jgi:hypothetical protein
MALLSTAADRSCHGSIEDKLTARRPTQYTTADTIISRTCTTYATAIHSNNDTSTVSCRANTTHTIHNSTKGNPVSSHASSHQ